MARLARVVAVDIPHHVTQRGNGRRFILASDSDRLVYLELLRQHCSLYQLVLQGYCLMSNHVHLIVTPRLVDSLALTLKHTDGWPTFKFCSFADEPPRRVPYPPRFSEGGSEDSCGTPDLN